LWLKAPGFQLVKADNDGKKAIKFESEGGTAEVSVEPIPSVPVPIPTPSPLVRQAGQRYVVLKDGPVRIVRKSVERGTMSKATLTFDNKHGWTGGARDVLNWAGDWDVEAEVFAGSEIGCFAQQGTNAAGPMNTGPTDGTVMSFEWSDGFRATFEIRTR